VIGAAWAEAVQRNAASRASDAMAKCGTVKTPAKRRRLKTNNERLMSMLLGQGRIEPVGDRGVG
jgi:hypothetical protein